MPHYPRPYRPEKASRFWNNYDLGDDNEWSVTKAFYIALHAAGIAYESRNRQRIPSDHYSTRAKFSDPSLMPAAIYLSYERLYALAHKARYDIGSPDEISDFEAEQAHSEMLTIVNWARSVCPAHIP